MFSLDSPCEGYIVVGFIDFDGKLFNLLDRSMENFNKNFIAGSWTRWKQISFYDFGIPFNLFRRVGDKYLIYSSWLWRKERFGLFAGENNAMLFIIRTSIGSSNDRALWPDVFMVPSSIILTEHPRRDTLPNNDSPIAHCCDASTQCVSTDQ